MLDIKKQLDKLFSKRSGGLMEDKYVSKKIKAGIWDQPPEFWRKENKDHKEEVPLPDDLLQFAHNGHKKWEQTCLAGVGVVDGKVSSKHRAQS